MKNLAYTFACVAALNVFSNDVTAQATACSGVTAPALPVGLYPTPIDGAHLMPGIALTTWQAGPLDRVEYVITLRGVKALNLAGTPDTTGGGGDVILGADDNGIFYPQDSSIMRLGLGYGHFIHAGDTFDITAVGYNLVQIKTLVHKLLTGTIVATGATCCQAIDLLAPGFCHTLDSLGIHDSSDVHNLNDVLAVFDAIANPQLSVSALIANMATVNSQGGALPSECGKNDLPICYGIDKSARYGFVAGTSVGVEKMSNISSFAMFPNPTANGVQVNIVLTAAEASDLALNVYNTLGERVVTQQLGVVVGQRTVTVATENFASGVYFVELTDGKNRETRKLIVR